MGNKQILSAVQIQSDEIRLLTGEFYNDCLYVLDAQNVKCEGLSGHNIIDKNRVCASLMMAIEKTNKELGTHINKVLLAIPSYRLVLSDHSFSNEYEQGHVIDNKDICAIRNNGYNYSLGSDYEIVNVSCNNYIVNGLLQKKPPIGLEMDNLKGEIQLMGCDKLLTYNYADVIEKCGLQIMDVCIDIVACAKETALLENAYQNYVVSINIEKYESLFTLAYKGKIISTEVINFGYDKFVNKITDTFAIPLRKSEEILFKFLDLGKEELTDTSVFVWRSKEANNQISEKQLFETIKPELDYLCNEYQTLCQQIFQCSNVYVQLTGKGCNINGLSKYFQKNFKKNVNEYIPNIIGVRDPIWTVPLGLIYNYLDQQLYTENRVNSVDISELEESLKPVKKEKSLSVTDKFKDFILDSVQQEENENEQ